MLGPGKKISGQGQASILPLFPLEYFGFSQKSSETNPCRDCLPHPKFLDVHHHEEVLQDHVSSVELTFEAEVVAVLRVAWLSSPALVQNLRH